MIEDLCRCEDRETLMLLSKTYGFDNPQLKQRVWGKMTSEQKDKVKAIANVLPNGVEVGKEYLAASTEPLKLLGVFEQPTMDGSGMILMGNGEYLSDGAPCEVRLDMLSPMPQANN
jgi:hypothetical protein